MTTRSQKRKTAAELASGEFEVSTSENNLVENLVAGPSKSPRIQPEKIDEIKTSLRKEIMSDFTKILADNQKEILKLIVSAIKKTSTVQNFEDSDSESESIQNFEDSDSESESIPPNTTSTPTRSKTATTKTTPVNCRNNDFFLVR